MRSQSCIVFTLVPFRRRFNNHGKILYGKVFLAELNMNYAGLPGADETGGKADKCMCKEGPSQMDRYNSNPKDYGIILILIPWAAKSDIR